MARGFGLDDFADYITVSTAYVPVDKAGLLGEGFSENLIEDTLNLHKGRRSRWI